MVVFKNTQGLVAKECLPRPPCKTVQFSAIECNLAQRPLCARRLLFRGACADRPRLFFAATSIYPSGPLSEIGYSMRVKSAVSGQSDALRSDRLTFDEFPLKSAGCRSFFRPSTQGTASRGRRQAAQCPR